MELAEKFFKLFEGNKRAYGMQFRLQNTECRPIFKGVKVSASETFRSINKAE